MFSFHKPRVYRSTQGCCICKAKSSSSRFTDSKKYENDFIECFQLQTPRKGEICNACVLLVKRFKRLPPGSDRHWGHVVDARVGPGLKSMTKFKKKKEESLQLLQQQQQQTTNLTTSSTINQITNNKTTSNYSNLNGNGNPMNSCTKSLSSVPERFCKIFKKNKKKKQLTEDVIKRIPSPVLSDEVSPPSSPQSGDSDDNHKSKEISANQDVIISNNNYDNTISNIFINNKNDLHTINNNNNGRIMKNYKRKSYIPSKNKNKKLNDATFIDNNLWKKQLTCCGIIYENEQINSVMINIDMYKPCLYHINSNNKKKADYIINQEQINITNKIPANIHDEIAIKNDELIRHIKSATNFIMNLSTNSSLQNSSILHHHHHYPNNNNNNNININTNNSINKNGKISDTVNINTTAVKKHHLYSKRQNAEVVGNTVHKDASNSVIATPVVSTINVVSNNYNKVNGSSLQILPINNQQQQPPPPPQLHTNKYNNYLHKIKETGKIIKNSSSTIINNDKLLTAAVAAAAAASSSSVVQPPTAVTTIKNNKNSLQDLNIVKNLVKLCTEKTTKNKLLINNDNKSVEILVTNKFSDNSSDSGYEETPQENQQGQQQGLQNGQAIRPLLLPSGIKLHVQQKSNLILNSNNNNNNAKLMSRQHEPQKLQLINKTASGVSKLIKKDIELHTK